MRLCVSVFVHTVNGRTDKVSLFVDNETAKQKCGYSGEISLLYTVGLCMSSKRKNFAFAQSIEVCICTCLCETMLLTAVLQVQ